MTAPDTPAPAWKAGDWAAVRIVGKAKLPGNWRIDAPDLPSGFSAVNKSSLHPMPSLSAEDRAVLDAAEKWVKTKGEFRPNALWPIESQRLFEAVARRASQEAPVVEETAAAEIARLRTDKDGAYLERNQIVAALARMFPSGIKQTAIEGWNPEWHGCVYIDTPAGQLSWHFHTSQAHLFDGLPAYAGEWDGHDTPEKYRRLARLRELPTSTDDPHHADLDCPAADAVDRADEDARIVAAAERRVVEATRAFCAERRDRFKLAAPENPTGLAVWNAVEVLEALLNPAPVDPVAVITTGRTLLAALDRAAKNIVDEKAAFRAALGGKGAE